MDKILGESKSPDPPQPESADVPETLIDVVATLNAAPSFMNLYGDKSMRELMADWEEVEVGKGDETWARFPPKDFIDFCRSYPSTPFDGIPGSTDYLKDPSFLISQAHRIWLTTSLAHQRLTRLRATSFLDLGSFPFCASLVLRDYFGYQGKITVTTNLVLGDEAMRFLSSKAIGLQRLDLDPYVRDPAEAEDKISSRIENEGEPFDLILSSHVIEHLYHPKRMIEECYRVLRSGGELIITTDNAMMIDTFAHFIRGDGFIFEPIETTAAMHFNFWRGHVRFFTAKDLQVLMEKSGFSLRHIDYYHCFYCVFFADYFRQPTPRLAAWMRKLISETSWLGNEVAVVATK